LKKSLGGTEDWTYGGFGSNWKAMEAVLRAKFAPGTVMARALHDTGAAFLLEHNAVSGRDQIWSDNHEGDGKNWLGMQLMLVRKGLQDSRRTAWVQLIEEWIDCNTGEPRDERGRMMWQQVVWSAAGAVQQACSLEESSFCTGIPMQQFAIWDQARTGPGQQPDQLAYMPGHGAALDDGFARDRSARRPARRAGHVARQDLASRSCESQFVDCVWGVWRWLWCE